MDYFKKNYLFFLLTIIIIFFHQYIFQSFFPNKNLLLGNDYSLVLPNFIFGKIWFNNNLLSIPWFSPSFCCGTPFFADPQTMYYSLQQLFFIFFSPLLALKIMFLFFSLISFLGVFFLMHKSFKKNIYISLIAASLFLFNGFFNFRTIVGHVAYLSYIFIPLYCYFLIKSFESKNNKSKCFFYNIISSLLFVNFIHSGSSGIIIVILLSIIFIISIFIYLNENYRIINYLILSFAVGLIISASKITASLSFLNNFPREHPPLVFENTFTLFANTFRSLFLYPNINTFNSNIINNVTNNLQVHEIEYGISVLPLIIFVIFFSSLKKINFEKFTLHKFISIISMFLIIFFITTINLSNNEFAQFFQKLPIVKNSWVHFRLTATYILPLIIISCLLIDKIFLKEKNIKIFTFVCLTIISIQNYYYEKNYYNNQKYNPDNLQKIHEEKEKFEKLKIKKTLLILDDNKKPFITIQRNDNFIYGFSPLLCYNPIFGYGLEKLPTKKLTFDNVKEVNNSLFHYTGDPKLTKDDNLNFFNPSCFVFPKENNCIPGDMFKKTQINELENFLNYKAFKFKLSKLQKIFNYISLISLIFSICFITYYLIKKIISNKSSDEQNH